MAPDYPTGARARTAWIRSLRPDYGAARAALSPDRPAGWLAEEEPAAGGGREQVLTVFLVNRECPFTCLMCDLWRHTTPRRAPPGNLPVQLDAALGAARGRTFQRLKLYNAGSLFDTVAVPPAALAGLAERCRRFPAVTVECHPNLVSPVVGGFRESLGEASLEVAMGLETVEPKVLAKLNKGMTLDDFRRAAGRLRAMEIGVRAFVLVKPPFMEEGEALDWACRSIDFAFDAGAAFVSLIPVRGGNGALEALAAAGHFSPPRLETLAAALEYGVRLGRGRVVADLWDLGSFARDPADLALFSERLSRLNLTQVAGEG